MLKRLLSHDLPRNRWLAIVLVLVVVALALTPFIFPGTKALNVAAKVIVFIVLAASFDLLLGYTGIVSFAHTMFFGIGAYGVAIAATRIGPTWPALALGIACAVVVSLALSLVIGLFSLRVRAIFFAMITLAVASAFATLASQLSDFTGGEDGLTFKVPAALQPGTAYLDAPLLGASVDGRLLTYYLLFAAALVLVLTLLRIVNSPFGRVLQAIRENDFRAEAIGYRTVVYRTIASVVSALFATLASQLSDITGGEDGLTFKVPEALQPGTAYADAPFLGASLDGRLVTYYLLFVAATVLVLMLLRIVNSPFGRVLQAIRENDFRAESIGYRTVVYRTIASVVSALFATLAGVLLALWLRYNGPDTTLSFEIMLDVLLIVVIGGMGTIYGAVVGSVLLVLAQNYLQDLMKLGESAMHGVPVLAQIVSPDRWLLWLGILFVLSVYYFPSGVVGRLRQLGGRKAGA